MRLTVEMAPNGYALRDEDDELITVVEDADEAEAARLMLWEVNERIGHIGSRHDAARVRIIVLPGDKWYPPTPESCEHPWVEAWGDDHWSCPCGARFGLVSPGRSARDLFEPFTAAAPPGAPDAVHTSTERSQSHSPDLDPTRSREVSAADSAEEFEAGSRIAEAERILSLAEHLAAYHRRRLADLRVRARSGASDEDC